MAHRVNNETDRPPYCRGKFRLKNRPRVGRFTPHQKGPILESPHHGVRRPTKGGREQNTTRFGRGVNSAARTRPYSKLTKKAALEIRQTATVCWTKHRGATYQPTETCPRCCQTEKPGGGTPGGEQAAVPNEEDGRHNT